MSSLVLKPKPSKQFFALIVLILCGSLFSLALTPLPAYLRLILALSALIYAGQVLWKDVMLHGQKAVLRLSCRLSLKGAPLWQLQERSQREYSAFLAGDSTLLGFAAVLRFKRVGQSGTKTTVVFQDSVDAETYRQLLMILGSTKIHYEVNEVNS